MPSQADKRWCDTYCTRISHRPASDATVGYIGPDRVPVNARREAKASPTGTFPLHPVESLSYAGRLLTLEDTKAVETTYSALVMAMRHGYCCVRLSLRARKRIVTISKPYTEANHHATQSTLPTPLSNPPLAVILTILLHALIVCPNPCTSSPGAAISKPKSYRSQVLTHATPGKFDSMTVDTRCSLKLLVA